MSSRTPEQLRDSEVLSYRHGEVLDSLSLLRPVVEKGRPQQTDKWGEAAHGALSSDMQRPAISETPSVDGSQAGVDFLARPASEYRIEE